jgi:hypothetical protein
LDRLARSKIDDLLIKWQNPSNNSSGFSKRYNTSGLSWTAVGNFGNLDIRYRRDRVQTLWH